MNIERKIEEIRQKPEHIRLRYIYGLVGISMFFIVILWFFSFFSGSSEEDPEVKAKNEEILRDFQNQKKSLEDVTKNTKESINNLNNVMEDEAFSEDDASDNSSSDDEITPGINQTPTKNTNPNSNSISDDSLLYDEITGINP